MALGLEINNPLNIRSTTDEWEGKVGEKKGFVQFDTQEHGLRAADITIRNYGERHGLSTLRDVINRFAPPTENDTDHYLNFISSSTGIDPDEEVNLSDESVRAKIVAKMAKMETGLDITPEEFRNKIESLKQQVGDITLDHINADEEEEIQATGEYEGTPYKKPGVARAAWAALANGGPDAEAVFQQMVQEITSFGESYTLDKIVKGINDSTAESVYSVIADMSQSDPETAQKALLGAEEVIRVQSNVREVALDNISAADSVQPIIQAQEYQTGYQKLRMDKAASRAAIAALQSVGGQGSLEATDIAADFGDMLLLEQAPLRDAARPFLGEDYNFLGGDMLRDLAQYILQAEGDERKDRALAVAKSIQKQSGLLSEQNDVVTAFALMTLEDYLTPGQEPGDFERWFHNIAGITEVVGILPLSAGVRATKNILRARRISGRNRAPIDDIIEANPSVGAQVLEAAQSNPELAQAMLHGDADVATVQRLMPQMLREDDIAFLEGAPASVVAKTLRANTIVQDIEQMPANTQLFAPEAWQEKERLLRSIVEDEKVSGRVKPSLSSFTRGDDNVIRARIVYGDKTDYPMTLGKAQAIAKRISESFEELGIKVKPRITARDPMSRIYDDADNVTVPGTNQRQYYVQVDFEQEMMYKDLTSNVPWTKNSFGGLWTHDSRNLVNQSLTRAVNTARERAAFLNQRLVKIADPFVNLGVRSKRKVSDLLVQLDDLGTNGPDVTYQRLKHDHNLNDKEIAAFRSMRVFYDTLYRVRNADTRKALVQKGFDKEVRLPLDGGDFENAAKVVSAESIVNKTSVVYDPVKGKAYNVSTKEGAEKLLQETGGTFVEINQTLNKGKSQYNYILVNNSNLSDLRQNVIPYRKNYVYRINTEPYYVQKSDTVTKNGQKGAIASRVLGAAANRADAERLVNRMIQAEIDELGVDAAPDAIEEIINSYSVKVDRNLDAGTEGKVQGDLHSEGNSLWYEKGDRLQTIDGAAGSIEEPMAALRRAASAASSRTTIGEAVRVLEEQHLQKYKHLRINGQPIWQFDRQGNRWVFNEVLKPKMNTGALRSARNEWDYLQSLKYSPTAWDNVIRGVLVRVDEMLASNKITAGASGLLGSKLSRGTIDKPLKAAAFTTLLGLRPTRQLVLQYLSGLHMTGVSPKITGQAFAESVPLMISMGLYDKPAHWDKFKKAMKTFGYTPDEWEEVFQQFRKTGKAYSIDSDIAVAEAGLKWSGWAREVGSNKIDQVLKDVKAGATTPLRAMKSIGFDMGEFGNQAVAWSFARRRWEELNQGRKWNESQQALDEVADMARDIGFDMTDKNAFAYQHGALGPMTQFMAINHKMLLKLLYGQEGARTWQARSAHAMGMLAMYGAAGFGASEMYDSFKQRHGAELPPDVDNVLSGGIQNLVGNRIISLALGEDEVSQLDFGKSLSPASGIISFIPDLIHEGITGDLFSVLAGPSGSVFEKFYRAASIGSLIAGRTDIDTFDKLQQIVRLSSSQFGTFSDVYKYNLAKKYFDKMDGLIDDPVTMTKYGPGVQATRAELVGKMLLGLELETEQEFWNRWAELNKDLTGQRKKTTSTAIEKDAEALAALAIEEYIQSEDELDYHVRMQALAYGLWDSQYGEEVLRTLPKYFSKHPRHEEFIRKVVNTIGLRDFDSELEDVINTVNSSKLIPEETKQIIVDGLKADFELRDIGEL